LKIPKVPRNLSKLTAKDLEIIPKHTKLPMFCKKDKIDTSNTNNNNSEKLNHQNMNGYAPNFIIKALAFKLQETITSS
jgi:hypothetical protein